MHYFLETFYAFLWILIPKSLEPIVMETQVYSIVVFSANRTPLFSEDGGPHVDVHASC